MTRFARIRRRPDHWASPHERARLRAAERLDGPLGLAEATWLDEHLAGCAACAAIAAAYEADRLALRAPAPTRHPSRRATCGRAPPPPSSASRSAVAAASRRSGGRPRSPLPLGALSGLAVIAVVVGVSAVSTDLFSGASTAGTLGGEGAAAPDDSVRTATDMAAGAAPTPFAVGAGEVEWVRSRQRRHVRLQHRADRRGLPVGRAGGCATLEDAAAKRFALTSEPETIIGSPTDDQRGRGQPGRRRAPVDRRRRPAGRRVDGHRSRPVSVPSAAPVAPSATTEPSVAPSSAPTAPTATADASLGASAPPASAPPPTAPPASSGPEIAPSPTPTVSPEPTVAGELALSLADDVEVVGPSAAFSADGTWFAFTARPADGSRGPDVYVWKVGDAAARPLTSDGRSTFASWVESQVLVSRTAVGDTTGEPQPPTTTMIDPVSGAETGGASTWRPVVDPSGTKAVTWTGSVALDTYDPALTTGRLELVPWPPTEDGRQAAGQVVVDAGVADFDVRWDGSGSWFAAWVADGTDAELGRLSLYRVDPDTGRLEQPDGAPRDVPALPGFSIGRGRLAWATPPGQGGEGSRVRIVAWSGRRRPGRDGPRRGPHRRPLTGRDRAGAGPTAAE